MNRPVGVVVACVLAAPVVHAADAKTGAYVGVLGGQASVSRGLDEEASVDTDKFTWGLNIGWKAASNLAFEFQYLKPRSISIQLEGGGEIWDIKDTFTGLALSALPAWQASESVLLFGRIGAIRAEEKIRLWIDGDYEGSASDHNTELLLGGGVTFLIDGAQLRLEYMRAKFEAGKVGLAALSVNWFLPRSP